MILNVSPSNQQGVTDARVKRARGIVASGSVEQAINSGVLPRRMDITLSEAVILGLVAQNVKTFLCVLGHGSTEIGEVLRVYHEAGLIRALGVHSEIEASHAAMALRWVNNEKAAVVTSIGPGALQAMAASIAPASDGIGVWYIFGDETSEDEGPNMQQIPGHEQHSFLRLCSIMGRSYALHTPGAVPTALRRGMNTVDHPYRSGPFYLLMPLNTQTSIITNFNIDELPMGTPPGIGSADNKNAFSEAVEALQRARRVLVRVGGGGRKAGNELLRFMEVTDAVAVTSPLVSGVIPYDNPRNMTVGGSKGSLCGNYAMENADLLVVVGSRFVCQSDCSRTAYPNVNHVININTDLEDATHYGRTTAMVGDAAKTLERLTAILKRDVGQSQNAMSSWMSECNAKRREWEVFKAKRYASPVIYDETWDEKVLTQPAVIKAATDWARHNNVVNFFDAGDVQANGFQIVEDDQLGRTFTETGASYMGFAVSALLSTAITEKSFYGLAFTGDGSFVMNPQILIDGVEHGARGCILLLDNRRMGAISGLQLAQYGRDHTTNDSVAVDYVSWARAIKGVQGLEGGTDLKSLLTALNMAKSYDGLSVVHIPVYFGSNELGGMGVFGRWNVGNWVSETQSLRHDIGL